MAPTDGRLTTQSASEWLVESAVYVPHSRVMLKHVATSESAPRPSRWGKASPSTPWPAVPAKAAGSWRALTSKSSSVVIGVAFCSMTDLWPTTCVLFAIHVTCSPARHMYLLAVTAEPRSLDADIRNEEQQRIFLAYRSARLIFY